MRKYFLYVVLVANLAIITFNSTCGQILLPLSSNLYPDTFAIYWSDNKIKNSVALKGELTLSIIFKTIFDDEVFRIDPIRDTLFALLLPEEFRTGEKFLIDPYFGDNHLVVQRVVRNFKEDYMLTLISRNQKISALRDLVATKPSINNFLLLAEAFEELECYVNAYYIYYRIMLDDPLAGEKYFHQFFNRNFKELDPSEDRQGAVHR